MPRTKFDWILRAVLLVGAAANIWLIFANESLHQRWKKLFDEANQRAASCEDAQPKAIPQPRGILICFGHDAPSGVITGGRMVIDIPPQGTAL